MPSSKQTDRPVQQHGPACPACREEASNQVEIAKFKRIYIKIAGCIRHLAMWDAWDKKMGKERKHR